LGVRDVVDDDSRKRGDRDKVRSRKM